MSKLFPVTSKAVECYPRQPKVIQGSQTLSKAVKGACLTLDRARLGLEWDSPRGEKIIKKKKNAWGKDLKTCTCTFPLLMLIWTRC